ncbi:endonuclease NucS domain-containing protein [Kitasatospora sp. NPDC089913]|uniref:endonuclease NucS domain-containing protein n=1 Tax=Kitasatospora sp. NPDC089913 TaxID=3364080 RepID=UPI00381508B4
MGDRSEAAIRDELAQNLGLIEPGLSLVGVEFHLKNAHGARGFVDILARDSLGNLVIIELKRSESTSRQAIHELFKYTMLVRAGHGIGVERLRCFLLSTSWSELLVPFSDFVRSVEFAAEAKRLVLDDAGRVTAILPVPLVTDPAPVRLLPWHSIYLYDDADTRSAGALELANGMRRAGISDYVLALLDHRGEGGNVIHRSAIYAAVSMHFADGRDLVPYTSPEYAEYDLLTYRASLRVAAESIEIGYPDKLRQILRSWEVDRVVRGGHFSSDALWSDNGLISLMLSEDGEHSGWLEILASPRHPPGWKKSLARIAQFLEGNRNWSRGIEEVLGNLEHTATASLEIFNPRDVIAAVGHAVRHENTSAFPILELIVDTDGETRIFKGFACWDGTTRPADPTEVLGRVLAGGAAEYGGLYHFDLMGSHDPALMAYHGLSYELFEVTDGTFTRRFDAVDGGWVEFDEGQHHLFRPTVEFLLANQAYCRALEALTHVIEISE